MNRALAVCWVSMLVAACYGTSMDEEDGSSGGASSGGAASKGGSAGKGGSNGGSAGKGGAAGSTSGGAGTSGSSSGGSSDGGAGGVAGFACPAQPPVSGSGCTAPDDGGLFVSAHCSWGDDPRAACRTTALCFQGEWQLTEPTAPACAEEPLPAACPTTAPDQGVVCDDAALECWYDDGTRCRCSPCSGGSEYPICQTIDPPEWACVTPLAGCPSPPAQAGSACDEEGLECGPDCELAITCSGGSWKYGGGNCPICAAPDTPIATPTGPRAIASLRVGELVYSVDDGAIVAVPIARTGSTPVANHRVVRLVLSDGAVLEMSPGHPTADGRAFADLLLGGALDAKPIVNVELVPYEHERTYDILPASSSGSYFAAGALVGSTLKR